MINGKHGQGTHSAKMSADKLAQNTPNGPKFTCPNCLSKPKFSGFRWKKASLGVRILWFYSCNLVNILWMKIFLVLFWSCSKWQQHNKTQLSSSVLGQVCNSKRHALNYLFDICCIFLTFVDKMSAVCSHENSISDIIVYYWIQRKKKIISKEQCTTCHKF